MQNQPFNQLPSLRQSLSDSSLRSNESGPRTASVNDPSSSSSITHHNNHTSSNSSSNRQNDYSHYPYHNEDSSRAHSRNNSSEQASQQHYRQQQQQQQHRYPSLTLPLPASAAFGAEHHSHQRPNANDSQHSAYATSLTPASKPSSSSLSSPFVRTSAPHHPQSSPSFSRSQQPDDKMYSNYAQQYPAQQLPSNVPYGAFQQQQQQQPGRMLPSAHPGMLPPVYSQNAYAAPSLPAPLPFDNSAAQQIPTPASTTHTLGSTVFAPAVGTDASFQGTRDNYKFELRVEQQPQRARMCGFGDKDRRPITPPPCVRLIVRRVDTDEEVDVDRLDGAFFVLHVNLWDGDGAREVNIIRASSSAPTQSISTAVQMGYPPPNNNMYVDNMGYSVGQFGMPNYHMPQQVPQVNSHVMYTRNLIGSLAVNASLLKDTDGNPGYWFVLSDLSVRTEGWFRLRLDFIDVGTPGANPGEATLNRRRCPVLASVFSEKFQVYSAKKFPGVIESTPLSKCFAHQGIKIPIRKDGKGDKGDDDDEDYKRGS